MTFRVLGGILTAIIFFSCCTRSSNQHTKSQDSIIYPELPLVLIGDTIPEPNPKDIRLIVTINGTCWTCMQDYSALKTVFSQIETHGLSVSYLIYIKAFDYEEVAASLALFQFFYPVYIDYYDEIHTLNNLDQNIQCLLADKDDRQLWTGAIPRSSSEMKKFLKVIQQIGN